MRRVSLVVALCLVIVPAFSAGRLESQTVGQKAPRARGTAPADAASLAARQRFLEMFARAYFPGRNGQLLIVTREGDFITRPDPDVAYMHGSPWAYDVSIPLMFVGSCSEDGSVLNAGRAAGRCANARGCAGCDDAPDRDGSRVAGSAPRFCPAARRLPSHSGWHATRLLRSIRRCDADALRAPPARRLVQPGARQLFAHEHRRWTLDDRDGNRSPYPRRHGQQHL